MAAPYALRMKCSSVKYRQGFLETVAGIHEGCVSLEVANVDPDINIAACGWISDLPTDAAVVANTEIEMTAMQARKLAQALLDACDSLG